MSPIIVGLVWAITIYIVTRSILWAIVVGIISLGVWALFDDETAKPRRRR